MKRKLTLHFGLLSSLFFVLMSSSVQAQTPNMPGWFSQQPLNINRSTCVARAMQALRSTSLQNARTFDGWYSGATSQNMRAGISCIEVSGGTMVSVLVAALAGYGNQAQSLRDRLRDYMQSNGSVISIATGEEPPSGNGEYVRAQKRTYAVGEQILVDYGRIPAGRGSDWVVAIPVGSAPGAYSGGKWAWVPDQQGTLTLSGLTRPGAYEIRYHRADGDKEIVASGGQITVQ